MSHKMAKAQRRAVRAIEKHPREVALQETPSGRMFIGVRKLVPSCGRAIYRTLKKAERKGLVQQAA